MAVTIPLCYLVTCIDPDEYDVLLKVTMWYEKCQIERKQGLWGTMEMASRTVRADRFFYNF